MALGNGRVHFLQCEHNLVGVNGRDHPYRRFKQQPILTRLQNNHAVKPVNL
jgi:hypothetical protein